MEQIKTAIRQMISISDQEMEKIISGCVTMKFKPKDFLSHQGEISQEVFFINKGITRSLVIDKDGNEHTIHFLLG